MENRSYRFDKWEFVLGFNVDGVLCTINYRNGEEEWGLTGEPKHWIDNAVSSTIGCILKDFTIDHMRAHEAVSVAYLLLLVRDGTLLDWTAPRAFVYRGGVWSIHSDDMHPDKPYAIGPTHEKIYNPDAFGFKDMEKTALLLMWADAHSEGKEHAKAYDSWESSWIDGPQP